jgi:hypothetical protein
MTRNRWIALAAALAAVAVVVVLTRGGDDVPGGGETRLFGAAVADPVPYDGRSPALEPGRSERVLVELPRPALGASRRATLRLPRQERAYVRSLRSEARALIDALRARKVKLRDVVFFERTWHGFAATIQAKDRSQLQSLGARVRANRRFFPAFSQPIPAQGPDTPAPAASAPRVTVLAGGVANARGFDAVDGDRRPLPGTDLRDPQRRETGGEPLAAAVESLGARVRVVRVSGLGDGEEYARTDTLLAGLEHTVDPDADGATSDHDKVALIGVSAPYAGFADSPEAKAVRAAQRLGVTVAAPAGDEGKGSGPFGTIGAPGASAGAIAVAPLANDDAVARTLLRVGNTTVNGAAVLAGTPPTGELTTARPPDANTADALLVSGDPLTDRLAIVEAGSNPGARAAAAAGAGAAAVLLAEPRDKHPLPTLPAGRVDVPVLGVTGPAAAAILALQAGITAEATGLQAPKPPFTTGSPSRFASSGPAYDGTSKPDLSRPGSIVAGGELISGGAVAAARVAVDAARGLDVQPAPDTAEPPATAPPSVAIGALTVDQAKKATSVQFSVGSFDRGDPAGGAGTSVVPAARLELTLTKAADEGVVERLTPPGGERGVLPGAYAYTLPRAIAAGLAKGDYVFRVSARAPRQTEPTKAASPPFTVA